MIQQTLFLLLSILVLCYNTLYGMFSKETTNLSFEIQEILIISSYILLSIYLPLYFLKAFHFNTIKFFAYWGGVLFLLLPYFLFHITPNYIIIFESSSSFKMVVPMVYGASMVYFYMTSLCKEYSNLILLFSKFEIVTIFVSLIMWSLLPIIMHFGINNLIGNFIVNSCFMFLIIILLKKNFSIYKRKYEEMLLTYSVEKDNEFIDTFNFTTREKEIISYLAKGYTYKEIGETLFISDRTVGKHVSNIYAKTGVNQKYDLLGKLNLITVVG